MFGTIIGKSGGAIMSKDEIAQRSLVHHPAEKYGSCPEVPTPTLPPRHQKPVTVKAAAVRVHYLSTSTVVLVCEHFGDINAGVCLICIQNIAPEYMHSSMEL